MRSTILTVATVLFLVAFSACDSDPASDNGGGNVQTTVATDIPADPGTGRDPTNGQLLGTTGKFTLFNLRDNQVVSSGTNYSAADSASSNWDIGFRATTVIVNGGSSGPGQGGAIVVDGIFEDYMEAPSSGYSEDTDQDYAVPAGSGNGWYNYNPQQMLLSPIPGRFLVVRTADGRYAKVRFLSYYKDAPDPVDPFTDQDRYYTFEFVFQPDGSGKFE